MANLQKKNYQTDSGKKTTQMIRHELAQSNIYIFFYNSYHGEQKKDLK